MLNRITNFFKARQEKAIVLMYHRICDLATDPWQLAVSPQNFNNQVEMITRYFEVLPVSDLIPQIKEKKIKHGKVYITFDDGYTDNYLHALPALKKYNCPATFFIPSYFTGKKESFWWDQLERIVLHSNTLPKYLKLQIGSEIHEFNIDPKPLTDMARQKQQSWKWPDTPVNNRCQLYLDLHKIFNPLTHVLICDAMRYLQQWCGAQPVSITEDFAMSKDQLKIISDDPLLSLGLHTQTHIALGAHAKDVQEQEIISNMVDLQKNNHPFIRAIAYPYGNYNYDTPFLVEKNNIDLGFTTNGAAITNSSSPFSLGRFQVTNCDAKTLKKQMERWIN